MSSTPIPTTRPSATCWRRSRSRTRTARLARSSAPSVGATDTNILVGAPGQTAARARVYEFEGDTTQPNFGDLLLTISNPGPSTPPAQFGAAVAGLGNDMSSARRSQHGGGKPRQRLCFRRHDRRPSQS